MAEEEQPSNGHWLGQVLEGGLPQVIAGPAGKALSRLIGGAADIPAAWLEQKAQAIRDETKARSSLMEQLSAKSAELGLKDEALLGRGLDSLLGRAYREQQNREEVAKKAIEQLEMDPPPESSEGPAEDWMNVFESHAAKASSDKLRTLFSQILAGEIRKPGAFSLSTLHLISVMNQRTAQLVTRSASYLAAESVIFREAVEGVLSVRDMLDLEEAGLITGAGGTLSLTPNSGETGTRVWPCGPYHIKAEFEPNTQLHFGAYFLTRAGIELYKIVPATHQPSAIAKAMWKAKAKSVQQLMLDPETKTPIGWMDLPRPA